MVTISTSDFYIKKGNIGSKTLGCDPSVVVLEILNKRLTNPMHASYL